jgi:hypothetical protein
MSGKVKVNREISNFIQAYVENVGGYPGWEDSLIYEHSQAWKNNFEGSKVEALCMKNISPFQLAVILINGYEVEETPKEKFNYFYDKYSKSDIQFEKDFLNGMIAVAEWFDLDVKRGN